MTGGLDQGAQGLLPELVEEGALGLGDLLAKYYDASGLSSALRMGIKLHVSEGRLHRR